MSFKVKLGCIERPLPVFKLNGCRWQYDCGWCGDVFMTPADLVRHVKKERAR